MRPRNHGMPTSRIRATAARRGTEVRDCSWRLVRVCSKLSTKLSAAAATSNGAARIIASFISWRSSSATMSGVMRISSKALQERVGQQVPTVDHDEEQNLERRGDHNRGQLKHADRGGDRGRHNVDEQKGEKQHRADGKA